MKNKKILVVLFLLIISNSLFSATKELVMGYRTNEKLPYIAEDPNNEGFYKDFYSEVARRMGYTLKIIRKPKIRIEHDLEDGLIDFYPIYVPDIERLDYTYFLDTGIKLRNIIITTNEIKDIKTISDLNGKIQIKSLGNANYLEGYDTKKITDYPLAELDLDRVMKLLLADRGDFFIYQEDVLRYYVKQNKIKTIAFHPNFLTETQKAYLGFSMKSKLFKSIPNSKYDKSKAKSVENFPVIITKDSVIYKVQEVMKAMEKDGFTKKLYEKYFY